MSGAWVRGGALGEGAGVWGGGAGGGGGSDALLKAYSCFLKPERGKGRGGEGGGVEQRVDGGGVKGRALAVGRESER